MGAAGEVEVVEIDPGRRKDRRTFTELPFWLAREHPVWQPGVRRMHEELIDPARYTFWKEHGGSFFVARRAGRIVGRIAVVDPGQIPQQRGAAVLAFPDFIDDPLVVDPLVEVSEARARERGATEMVGPMNPDIHHDVGIQIEGNALRNSVFMGYQPAYYARHFERLGYARLADFEAWGLYRDTFEKEGRLSRLARRVERNPALSIRPVDLSQFATELRLFHRLYSTAFVDHWGFSPPTWEEFRFVAGDLKHVLRSRMALVAEWEGEPVGFVLGIPDLYGILPKHTRGRITPLFLIQLLLRWRSMDEARVMIAGVLPEYRAKGVHLPLFYHIAREIFELGFRGGEISWVLADNDPMAKSLPLLGASRTKTYRLYQKSLHQ